MPGDGYECDQCCRIYPTEDLLQRHIRKIHVGPRWRCPECEYSSDYSDRPGLRRHLQIDHHYSKERSMEVQFTQVRSGRKVCGGGRGERSRSPPSSHHPYRGGAADGGESTSRRSWSKSPPKTQMRSEISDMNMNRNGTASTTSKIAATRNSTTLPSTTQIPYPSQISRQIINEGAGGGPHSAGLRATWTGVVPKGASITHLGVPQPVIERHFIQTDDDTILVKEVFLFQAPLHWQTFQDSKFEIETPSGSAVTSLNRGQEKNHREKEKQGRESMEKKDAEKENEEEEEGEVKNGNLVIDNIDENNDNSRDNRDIVITVNGDNTDDL